LVHAESAMVGVEVVAVARAETHLKAVDSVLIFISFLSEDRGYIMRLKFCLNRS
jgi:hypothetical protein